MIKEGEVNNCFNDKISKKVGLFAQTVESACS
jgi:hypothetical protein